MRGGSLSGAQLAEVCKGVKAAPDKAEHLLQTARRFGFGGLRDEVKRVIAAADPEEHEQRVEKATLERRVRFWDEGDVGHIEIIGPLHRYAAMRREIEHEARGVFRQAHREGRREPHEAYCFDAVEQLITGDGDDHDDEPTETSGAATTTRSDATEPTTSNSDEHQTVTAPTGTAMAPPSASRAGATSTETNSIPRDIDEPDATGPMNLIGPTASGNDTTNGSSATADDATRGTRMGKQPRRKKKRRRARHLNMNVVVSLDALRRGEVEDGEVCEIPGVGPVPVSVAREYLGDAFLSVIIRDGKDIRTVVHLGRYIPTEIRTALSLEVPECIILDCANRGYLETDHHHDYAKGGPTAFGNLGGMCRPHQIKKNQGYILGPPDPHTGKRKLYPPGTDPSDLE
jgi:hypothetical protein